MIQQYLLNINKSVYFLKNFGTKQGACMPRTRRRSGSHHRRTPVDPKDGTRVTCAD